jgi:regulatory subunit for Cdc7p protein kinase
VFDTAPSGKAAASKTRSVDVLDRALEMGKKIWSLEKLQKILKILEENDPRQAAATGHDHGSTQSTAKVATGQPDIKKLLDEERVHGPSDRDPTVPGQELYKFRGYYIYVYDLEEKTKPIMAREFRKVPDREGEWPQFRSTSTGRCPFVVDENYDDPEKEYRERERERARAKARAAKAAAENTAEPAVQQPKASEVPPPKPATGKRTLSQMEDGHNRGMANVREKVLLDRSKISNPPAFDFQSQNAFVSHAKAGRFLAGEPVASGLQPSNITSAIRSQMISSTGGVLGAKAGTSKEIHGLQRKVVLQKTGAAVLGQDLGSLRRRETSHTGTTFGRSASLTGVPSRRLDPFEEEERLKEREKLRRTVSVPVSQPKPRRDPKPGYCENCMDRFADFEEVRLATLVPVPVLVLAVPLALEHRN